MHAGTTHADGSLTQSKTEAMYFPTGPTDPAQTGISLLVQFSHKINKEFKQNLDSSRCRLPAQPIACLNYELFAAFV
jgi:hypothetical protein